MRVVAASGAGTDGLVGSSARVEDDLVASTVIGTCAPLTWSLVPGGLPRGAPVRLAQVGAARAVVAVPAIVRSRVVAIVEVVDAKESADPAVEAAARYAGSTLADFLVARKQR